MSLLSGTTLGPYEILSPLGAGGMGEVYRARDSRLDRDVAIKVLPERTANDADALARFEREAKAVAALSHPNILAIYDVGAHQGVSYVVTELLDGETLRERLRRSAIPWRKAVEIGIEIAEGLSAAHSKGVIHRDLKPENLFITTAGHMKILDFGLARIAPDTSLPAELRADTPTMTLDTRPGTVLGTVNYMSPEQISGRMTDPRTDIFSFGCVLYEMISGRRAFGGESVAEITTAILRDEPPTLSDSGRVVPVELDRVIMRCHEKKPEQRIQSARDLSFALRDLLSDSGPSKRPATYAGLRTRTMLVVQLAVGVVAVAALLLTLNVGGWRERLFSRPQVGAISSLAVLPLENVSRDPEQEYFVDGMTEALISDLAKIGGLKVISRTSVMRYKATTKSLPEIAKELNVDAVVEGSVLRVGDRVRITAQLIHAATDEHLWAESYDRDLRDVLRLQSEVARTIAQEIKVTLTPQEQARMVEARPINPEVHDLYLRGRFFAFKQTEEGLRKGLDYFTKAIEKDPGYAPAYAGIAYAYVYLADSFASPKEAYPKAKAAVVKALELDGTNAEAHTYLGLIQWFYDWEFESTDVEFLRALQLSPNSMEAHNFYGMFLCGTNRLDEGLAEANRAIALDPLSPVPSWIREYCLVMARRYDETIAQCKRSAELDPNSFYLESHAALAYREKGMFSEAVAEYQRLRHVIGGQPMYGLGITYARMGRTAEAREVLREYLELSERKYVSPDHIALIYASLGEKDQAFAWLDRAYDARSGYMISWILVSPDYDRLRSDPRFDDLLRRIGLSALSSNTSKTSLRPRSESGSNGTASPLTKYHTP